MLEDARAGRRLDARGVTPAEIVAVGGTVSNLLKVIRFGASKGTLTRDKTARAMALLAAEPAALAAKRHGHPRGAGPDPARGRGHRRRDPAALRRRCPARIGSRDPRGRDPRRRHAGQPGVTACPTSPTAGGSDRPEAPLESGDHPTERAAEGEAVDAAPRRRSSVRRRRATSRSRLTR